MAAAAGPDLLGCPGAQRILPILSQPCSLGCMHFPHPDQKHKAQPVGYGGALFALLGKKKKKILDLKDRLNIQTVDFENWLQEQSHEVPFEQRGNPPMVDAGRRGRSSIKHVTFISFSFNLQVIELVIVRDKRQSSLED